MRNFGALPRLMPSIPDDHYKDDNAWNYSSQNYFAKTRGASPTTGLHPSRGDYVSILYYEQHWQRDVSLHDDLNYIDHYTSLFKGH